MTFKDLLTLLLLFALAISACAAAEEPKATLETRAVAALDAGDRRAAVHALERLRFQNQLSDSMRLALAQTYLEQGRLDEARIEAERIEYLTVGADLLWLRARLAAREGQWAEARDRYLAILRIDPDSAEAYLGLGQSLQELGDTASADAAFAGYVRYND
ncbi:MAG TPA: tetratricopeptide repeat protein [Chromatiaceae bacterium]|jgi:Flp pilus assembly protein TadD|nr:MAG: hypothetical protein N838_13220 [Thiohalocapsa sp. PB-PSB1]QQO54356.1 MAG: tetratricopeptide repeat protein [Thiohalocapsa sp. PB-PSB1]HBG96222.1 tetratricopeptide repeat protein [Chromatiaceae bacterium]